MRHLAFPSRLLTGAAVVASALVVGGVDVAQADTFTPANSNPTVATPSLSAAISPDAGQSASQYSYSVTVGDADTLNDLDTVTLCLYHTTAGDATCATPDPATDVKLVWTQSTNSFSIDDGSVKAYWDLGSAPASSAPTLTGVSGTYTFTFFVSEVMRKGGWTAKVTATDGNGGTDAVNSAATSTVSGYAAITTRVSQSFGTIASGGAAAATASPTVTSNGATTFSLTAGNFTSGSYSFSLLTTAGAPAAGQVVFECNIGAAYDSLTDVRIGSTSTVVSAAQTANGTVEDGSALQNSCQLSHGGGRPIGSYAFTVVNSIAIN